MAETTQPTGAVEQAAPSVEQRMAAFLDQHDKEAAEGQDLAPETPPVPRPVKAEVEPKDPPKSDELTVDDLPEAETQLLEGAESEADEFEFVHNGQPVKVPRAKAIELARQGFDYTQKTQKLAEDSRATADRLARVQEMEQVLPHLVQDAAQVTAWEAQLKPYQSVDWVALATNDPLAYPQHRAKYDQLINSYQASVNKLQQTGQFIQQRKAQLTSDNLRSEHAKVLQKIPAWSDPQKYQQGAQELRAYLIGEGADPRLVDSLDSSVAVTVAWKAAQYDKLLKAKTEKVKELRTAPPVTRPGARQTGTAQAEKTNALQKRLHKTGDVHDAAAALLDRWK